MIIKYVCCLYYVDAKTCYGFVQKDWLIIEIMGGE